MRFNFSVIYNLKASMREIKSSHLITSTWSYRLSNRGRAYQFHRFPKTISKFFYCYVHDELSCISRRKPHHKAMFTVWIHPPPPPSHAPTQRRGPHLHFYLGSTLACMSCRTGSVVHSEDLITFVLYFHILKN